MREKQDRCLIKRMWMEPEVGRGLPVVQQKPDNALPGLKGYSFWKNEGNVPGPEIRGRS